MIAWNDISISCTLNSVIVQRYFSGTHDPSDMGVELCRHSLFMQERERERERERAKEEREIERKSERGRARKRETEMRERQ